MKRQKNKVTEDMQFRQDLMSMLKSERTHYTEEIKRLSDDINEKDTQFDELRLKYTDLHGKYEDLIRELSNCKVEISKLKEIIEDYETRIRET